MTRFLVVDDDPSIRVLFARALTPMGEVDQAAGGFEALRNLAARPYDLIVLDVHMPVIDGFQVLKILAAKPGPNRETPVCVITADVSERARVKALELSVVFFMTKPLRLATLTELVQGILQKAPKSSAGKKVAKKAPDRH